MKLLGFELTRQKSLSQPSNSRGGWLPIIRESYAGAWQQNVEIDRDLALTYFAVFSCMTLIASDIAKLRLKMMQRDANGIWSEVDAFNPIFRKPNGIQTRIQFWETYFLSKLANGNVYVLKERGLNDRVAKLHTLDPRRVKPLIAPDGSVFYQLDTDAIAGIEDQITVPASEVIHDRFNCLYHPLIGLSPLVAAGLAAMQGTSIQRDSANFFANRSIPGGILVAPGAISQETANKAKLYWEENYGGANAGKIAVLGDGMKFEAVRQTSEQSQVIEQLRWSAEVVCSAFHVPPYKIGIGQMPAYNNIQALNVEYYSQALQVLMESAELALDEGLDLPPGFGVEFDISDLLRMDSTTQMAALKEAVGAGVMAPNEARRRIDLKPVAGGDLPYLQQQNFSLEALAERERNDPFAKPAPAPATEPEEQPDEERERSWRSKALTAFDLEMSA